MAANPYKRPDHFTRAAKKRGFAARSVFKLEDIDRRVRLFRQGQRVLDLGAAPGSWSQYAGQRIAPGGKVLAVDLAPLAKTPPANVTFLAGDVLALSAEAFAALGPYDVVLSDMAPSTTGTRESDQAKSFELFMRALEIAGALLSPGGSFVGKIFMGPDFSAAKRRVKDLFETERAIRPEGTRGSSVEIFLVGLGRRA
ncbi:MAG TPA: RlmE family RNA methyltransferase [Polyangiaceae bacterium]|jgi:23S rRNA (uridine2552-2'-O)-methyltransferase|nr:RlmE family RNA methyltransferase [Polyangiaceae bacterium]